MIGRIRGTLVYKQPPDILVDVGGVGYDIQVPMSTLFQLPEVGADVTLLTHFVVREDAQLLYGFIDERDRALFRQLVKVSGVGPKLALTILSGMDAVAFARCVQWAGADAGQPAAAWSPASSRVADAEGALIALGYKPAEAARMVAAVDDDEAADSEVLIRRALKAVVQR